MLDYATLRLIWWLLLGTLLSGFAIMDGFDLGIGILFRFLGRTDAERERLLGSIEPVWDGNQVWLLLGAGAVFAAWPLLYAASFSGLYLALLLLLVALILRPVGFGFRGLLNSSRWRTVWDQALFIAGAVPALLFGVAVGNLFLGVPFHFDALMRPVYTGGFFNLLHPFALLSGIVSLAMLTLHGACYAGLKSEASLASRAATGGRLAASVFASGFIAAGIWLGQLPGDRIISGAAADGPSNPLAKSVVLIPGAWLGNLTAHPVLWLIPGAALLGAFAAALLLQARHYGAAFCASSLTVASTIFTAGVALFPFLMPSSAQPSQGLTVWDASSSAHTLSIMLIAVALFLPVVLLYTIWVFRVLRRPVAAPHRY